MRNKDFKKTNAALVMQVLRSGKGVTPAGPTPVAWWKINEATGTTLNDSSGNGFTLTVGAAQWTTLPGFAAPAFQFNPTVHSAVGSYHAQLDFGASQTW